MSSAPSAPLRVALADDEPLARERLRALVAARSDILLVGEARNGTEALEVVRSAREDGEPLDLLLLDVQMPGADGLEVAEALSREPESVRPAVVFVTAFDRYAVRAFDLHALDYVLKPVEDDRFHDALDRAVARRRSGESDPLSRRLLALIREASDSARGAEVPSPASPDNPRPRQERPLRRIAVQSAGRYHLVDTRTIDWIEGAGVYVKIVIGDKTHLLRTTLADLEDRLDEERFVRIHRSTIANLDRVREVRPRSHGEYALLLDDGTRLKVSRTYSDRIRSYLERLS